MATFMVITTLISLLAAGGFNVANLYTSIKNQELRDRIQLAVSAVTQQLKTGRLKASRVLALLNNKNAAALQNYLYSNPMVGKTFQEIQEDGNKIAKLQSELNSLENEISQYQSELSSLGYAQSHQGLGQERSRFEETKQKLDEAVKKHKAKTDEIAATDVTIHRPFVVDTSHLDAVSQNIAGGLNNNA